jgi:dCMP deaminase
MKKKFIDYYMDVALRTAELSVAKRLHVGCIIVKNDSIISHSWNGTPPGWDNTCEDENNVTKPEVCHAEMNAVAKLAREGISGKDATVFCTHSACVDCAKLMYSAGIKEVYYKEDYRSKAGIEFLEKCGVKVTKIED